MRTSFETCDQQSAYGYLQQVFDSQVRFLGDPGHLRVQAVQLGPVQLVDLDYHVPLTWSAHGSPWLGVAEVRGGSLEDSRSESARLGPGTLLASRPAEPSSGRSGPRLRQRLLRVDAPSVERAAHERGGRHGDAVLLARRTVADPAAVQTWRQLGDLVAAATATELSVLTHPLSQAALARLVAHTALSLFHHETGDLRGDGLTSDGTEGAVRRALAFIESNAHTDISLVEIAAAAYVTPRALQYGFRRVLDTTPMAHLRRVRLHHVRAELLEPVPGTTVAQVAGRWGFFHLGRFARYYRDEFGENPAQTLTQTLAT